LIIGTGAPKVVVPIVGKTQKEILDDALAINALGVDVIEWRADFYADVLHKHCVKETFIKLRTILGNAPLIFTIRTSSEGGYIHISDAEYVDMLKFAAETGYTDIIDVELFRCGDHISELVDSLHSFNIVVIMSNHDFHATPDKEEIVSRLQKMQEVGGDLLKIAVMPNSSADVITLLQATNEMASTYAKKPLITMSMGRLGSISRLTGEIFGSSMTFGSAGKSSAPGQITVNELKACLKTIHASQNLS
jgi:3-dehydroquinate dehydratase I